MDRQTVYDYIKKKYKAAPEYPWRSYPGHAVFRHEDNQKWFALTADVAGKTLGMPDADLVDVINLKVDDLFFRDMLSRRHRRRKKKRYVRRKSGSFPPIRSILTLCTPLMRKRRSTGSRVPGSKKATRSTCMWERRSQRYFTGAGSRRRTSLTTTGTSG